MKLTNAVRPLDNIVRRARVARQTGRWPAWRWHTNPDGASSARGWAKEMTRAAENGVFVVLVRELDCAWGRVRHAMITDPILGVQPTWAERQRIKSQLFGRETVAVDVLPAESQLVDGADAYHLWVLPAGFVLPFGLHAAAQKEAAGA